MPATLTTLINFNLANGAHPTDNLIFDALGNLFGTTDNGGASGNGTVFEIAKTGIGYASTPTTLVSFNGTNGMNPFAGLAVDSAGNLFGTTAGGTSNDGTVFEILKTSTGYASTPNVLINFSGVDGINPQSGLVVDAAGNLFGTTTGGGTNGDGTVFEIVRTSTGYASTPTTLVSFNGANGFNPTGGLFIDATGNLFGTTLAGGANFDGSVFEIAKSSTGYASNPTTLASFNVANGLNPRGTLIADASGNLFGTTSSGGANNSGTVFELTKTSTGYSNTPTTLVSFSAATGDFPFGGLIIDAAGNLFGMTNQGGANNDGTVFEIAKTSTGYANTPLTLVTFNGTNGAAPFASLAADRAGNLFGTTLGGGTSNFGTAFEITGSGFVPFLAPSGFSFTPDTSALKAIERGGAGLRGNTLLGTFTEKGGAASDNFTFTLAGPDSNAFVMNSGSNAGKLGSGAGGDLGTRNGKLYALTVQVNDTTNGLNSGPLPFDVVVGRGGSDTINPSALGIASTTPTFIYGLRGDDKINASGMTGPVWIAGGKGADTMTGGSGPNTYLYATTKESTPNSFDVITNFNVSGDKIDLTGLGLTPLSFLPGHLVGNASISGHSIAWQNTGGNTFVYINTSGGMETKAGADMKIELKGNLTLTAGDFLHH